MLFSSLFVAFVAFPESNDAIFARERKENIEIKTSGSLGFYYKKKCHNTYGNETITGNEDSDWCSNFVEDKRKENNPFIQFSIKGKQMKVNKFSVRNGCCRGFVYCCAKDSGKKIDGLSCCELYSYSLHGSNDGRTWNVLSKTINDKTFDWCQSKTFEIKGTPVPYTYIRFVLDEELPGCKKCFQINQIELYGETIRTSAEYEDSDENIDEDNSVSIIGRIKKNK